MTNISGAPSPIYTRFLRGDQEGVGIHGGGGGVSDKIPFQAEGRPTSKAGAPLPGHPGTEAAAAAEGAIHILVCDARRAAEPALLRNMLTFSRGRCWGRGTSTNILDTSRLRG